MTKLKPIIGLEVHIQVKTKSKMFSSVSADYYGKEPNTCVDPVTLGLPGALPVPNKKAIVQALRLAMALNCEINRQSKFDRKNYFYPDLPKGYQISQYDQPFGGKGNMEFSVKISPHKYEKQKITITRLHLEEDTGKSIHQGNETLLDFNKAGVPLIEVVTEPEFTSGAQIDAFAKRLRQIVRYLGVSDGDMEKGQMRYELNISMQKEGETELPNYKVEVKNIGSISLLQKVMDYEIDRQSKLILAGEKVVQETRGTRDMSGETYSQRVKEEAADYRYFPEPDIPPFNFTEEFLTELRGTLPKLPEDLFEELTKLGIAADLADGIVASKSKAEFFLKFREITPDRDTLVEVAKLIAGELTSYKQLHKVQWTSLLEGQEDKKLLIEIVRLKLAGKINSTAQKQLLEKILSKTVTSQQELSEAIQSGGLIINTDTNMLEDLARRFIGADPTAKERFAKNPNMAMFFVGQIMKETKGSADPQAAKEAVEKVLKE